MFVVVRTVKKRKVHTLLLACERLGSVPRKCALDRSQFRRKTSSSIDLHWELELFVCVGPIVAEYVQLSSPVIRAVFESNKNSQHHLFPKKRRSLSLIWSSNNVRYRSATHTNCQCRSAKNLTKNHFYLYFTNTNPYRTGLLGPTQPKMEPLQ